MVGCDIILADFPAKTSQELIVDGPGVVAGSGKIFIKETNSKNNNIEVGFWKPSF